MPRPGPRPYECIRRAWHSESHQALRGSLTQEIFRIVTEFHRPDTRGKREWQEKLPIVVLRAEEILYSKARTEAEYADASTLKERLDDAVNTMIRRTDENRDQEAAADGPFMEPCVEAALSLGCAPKMNPRGQRSCPARISNSSASSLRRTSSSATMNPISSCSPSSSTSSSSSSSSTTAQSCCSSISSSSAAASMAISSTATATAAAASTSSNQSQSLAFLSLESPPPWPKPRAQAHPSPTSSPSSMPEAPPPPPPSNSMNRPPCFATTTSSTNPNLSLSIISGIEAQRFQKPQQQQQQQNLSGFSPHFGPPRLPPMGSFRLQPEQSPTFPTDQNYTSLHHLHQHQLQQVLYPPSFQNPNMAYHPQQVQTAPPHQHTSLPAVFPTCLEPLPAMFPISLEPGAVTHSSLPGMFPTSLEPNSMQTRFQPRVQPEEEHHHDLELCLGPPKISSSSRPKSGASNSIGVGRHLGDPAASDGVLSGGCSNTTTTLKKAKIVLPL